MRRAFVWATCKAGQSHIGKARHTTVLSNGEWTVVHTVREPALSRGASKTRAFHHKRGLFMKKRNTRCYESKTATIGELPHDEAFLPERNPHPPALGGKVAAVCQEQTTVEQSEPSGSDPGTDCLRLRACTSELRRVTPTSYRAYPLTWRRRRALTC